MPAWLPDSVKRAIARGGSGGGLKIWSRPGHSPKMPFSRSSVGPLFFAVPEGKMKLASRATAYINSGKSGKIPKFHFSFGDRLKRRPLVRFPKWQNLGPGAEVPPNWLPGDLVWVQPRSDQGRLQIWSKVMERSLHRF